MGPSGSLLHFSSLCLYLPINYFLGDLKILTIIAQFIQISDKFYMKVILLPTQNRRLFTHTTMQWLIRNLLMDGTKMEKVFMASCSLQHE